MLFKCIDCNKQFNRRGFLNHLHIQKEEHWYEQWQNLFKNEFNSYKMSAEFISFADGVFTYRCSISGEVVSSRKERLEKSKLCKCKQCQWKHKSKVSKMHWLKDGAKHSKAISKALLNNQRHRERSSLLFTKMYLEQNGHKPWSKYEQEISDYLTKKSIKHECNSIVLHLDGTTKNYIYDIYIPEKNLLIELNDRHFNNQLYSLEEAQKIPFKTYRNEAIHDITKYELAISKGYKCYFFFDLKDCKEFIDYEF